MQLLFALLLACLFACTSVVSAADTTTPSAKLRLLVVYGGHGFETNQFFQLFRDNPAVTFRPVAYPGAEEWYTPARAQEYDVLVFYDMWQSISAEGKTNLLNLVRQGKPLLALHHCLASFQKWDDYADLIGGQYHLEKWKDHGVDMPASTYLHDVDFKIHIADPQHPITRGMSDFAIHDETYGGFEVKPGVKVLLTTDAPTSGPAIAWCKDYGAGRVVYIQSGHDHQAYDNPNYRRLLRQAIEWVAPRP